MPGMRKAANGVITVKGMKEKDLPGVYQILFSLPGLNRAAADTATGRVSLEFEAGRYGLLTAALLLRQAGFPAVVGEYG